MALPLPAAAQPALRRSKVMEAPSVSSKDRRMRRIVGEIGEFSVWKVEPLPPPLFGEGQKKKKQNEVKDTSRFDIIRAAVACLVSRRRVEHARSAK